MCEKKKEEASFLLLLFCFFCLGPFSFFFAPPAPSFFPLFLMNYPPPLIEFCPLSSVLKLEHLKRQTLFI